MKNVISGFLMGVAEMLPGISGSTVALILGLFDKLINQIDKVFDTIFAFRHVILRNRSFKEWFSSIWEIDIRFIITLGIGAVASFVLMSNVIVYLFDNFPHLIVALLLGLVLSTLVIPFSQIKKDYKYYLVTFVVAGVLFWILGHDIQHTTSGTVSPLYLFVAGFLAGVMMPGLNGSFILLIMGVYYYSVNLMKRFFEFDIDVEWAIQTTAFLVGLITGFVTTAEVMQVALRKYRSLAMAVIGGLLLGSIRILNPFIEAVKVNGEPILTPVPIRDFDTNSVILILTIAITSSVGLTLLNISRARKGAFDGENV